MNKHRPTSGPLAELTEKEFSEFIWALGTLSFNSVQAAAFARHKHPLDTLKDYMSVPFVCPEDSRPMALAKEYLRDITARVPTTAELSQKWFGKTEKDLAGEASKMLDGDL